MKFFNIRVVEAEDFSEAIDKVQSGYFEEEDNLCDTIYTLEELKTYLSYE